MRFETRPGEQSQLDWAHFGSCAGHRLYAFALTLGYSRMRYVEMVHAFHCLGGITEVILTDNIEERGAREPGRTGAVEPPVSGLCQLLRLPAARLSSVSTRDEREDRTPVFMQL
jgi:hypothetical protein